jgi:uncharacterized nucleotidyltransferase DUF6036
MNLVKTMYYLEVLEALYRERIRYMIVGGLAVNLYGVPRVTQDIDVIISTERENVLNLLKVLTKLEYVPRLPVKPEELADKEKVKDRIENRNLKAFSFYHRVDPYKIVDILFDHPLDFERSEKNKTIKRIGEIDVYIVSMDDLIRMKEKSGRSQDTSDVEMLNKVKSFMEG